MKLNRRTWREKTEKIRKQIKRKNTGKKKRIEEKKMMDCERKEREGRRRRTVTGPALRPWLGSTVGL